MSNDANVSKRDGFRSRGGFIIACIGSAVGMGNIWRFPTLEIGRASCRERV